MGPGGFRNKNTSSSPAPKAFWTLEPFAVEALWGVRMCWGHMWPSTDTVALYYCRTWLRTEADPNNGCVSSVTVQLPSCSTPHWARPGALRPSNTTSFPQRGKQSCIPVWVKQTCTASCLKCLVPSTVRKKKNSVFALKELTVSKRLELQ